MRLEQLVLFGPSDDFRVHFGSQVTVLSGLHPEERAGLIATLIDAMAGQLPNSSVIYVDSAGRRVFADRSGSSYADTGVAAPHLTSIVGHDPKDIARLMVVRAEDLGLGNRPTNEQVEAQLTAAQAAAEQLHAERAAAAGVVINIEAWKAELTALDARIAQAADDQARWSWMQLRNELDGLRAELAAFAEEPEEVSEVDARLLEAIEELRAAGEAWTTAEAQATELLGRIGSVPPITDAGLDAVSSTPAALPEAFDAQVTAWEQATERRRRSETAHLDATVAVPDHDDELVTRLAHLDQVRLWPAHTRLLTARARYEAERLKLEDEVDPGVEADIEDAHFVVLRCQRRVDRLFLPGVLGSGTLAVGALLAGDQISILLGVVMLVASVAMGWWLLAIPRKVLAEASREEEMALGRANAGSWLGLHLRRIDDVMQPADRRGLDAAVDAYGSAQLDWEELAPGIDPDEAEARRDAVIEHLQVTDPELRERRERETAIEVREALEAEVEARATVLRGLRPYGLTEQGASDLDAEQLRKVLVGRIEAGQYARDARRLRELQATAASTGALLERILAGFGFIDGRLETRLDRAMEAVTAVHGHHDTGETGAAARTRADIERDIARMEATVEAGRRLSWDLTPEPAVAPVDVDTLTEQRRAAAEQIASTREPDLAELDRLIVQADEFVRTYKRQLMELAEGPTSLHRRISDRVGRTTWLGDQEESIPVMLDDAFQELPQVDRVAALDLLARLSARTQVLLLSNDPVVAGWARRRATTHGDVTLFEANADVHAPTPGPGGSVEATQL